MLLERPTERCEVFLSHDSQVTAEQGDFGPTGRPGLISWTKLRIDPNDGSPGLEYRIEDGRVERRTLTLATDKRTAVDGQWQQLMPEELASLCGRATILSHWLRHRLEVQSLIRALTTI